MEGYEKLVIEEKSPSGVSAFPSQDHFRRELHDKAHEEANRCIQCGYCLPVCPTFVSMGHESASPRGRINLVKAAAEGKIDILKDMAKPLDLCLGCRACELACPVGVKYGNILEAAKATVAGASAGKGRRLQSIFLRHLFPFPRRMRLAGNIIWLARTSGLHGAVVATGLLKKVSPAFGAMAEVLPLTDPPWRRPRPGAVFPSVGERKARVAFFTGCVMDATMSRINRLSIELLCKVGCEVTIVKNQRCCGALHAHQGFEEEARELAKANIEAFEGVNADYYVNNAGGCGAMLHGYGAMFRDDPVWRKRAEDFVSRSRDITEVLVECGPLTFIRPVDGFVTYQDSCHLRNVQKVLDPPRELLRQAAAERFVELPGSSDCCASGGIYNLLHFRESMAILDSKMQKVKGVAATIIVTTNPGCQLQMAIGIRRAGLQDRVRACHIVELLAEVT